MMFLQIQYFLQMYSHIADWMLAWVLLKVVKVEQNAVSLSTISFAKLEMNKTVKITVWQKPQIVIIQYW